MEALWLQQPGDVGGQPVVQGNGPLLHRGAADAGLAVAASSLRVGGGAPVGIGRSVGRVAEDAVDGADAGGSPFEVAAVRPVVRPDAEPDVIPPEVAHEAVGGAQLVELLEDQPDDGPGLF